MLIIHKLEKQLKATLLQICNSIILKNKALICEIILKYFIVYIVGILIFCPTLRLLFFKWLTSFKLSIISRISLSL